MSTTIYDRQAIFLENGPFDPSFMQEAVRTLLRSLPLDPAEPQAWQHRRMNSALLALSALHPRDEIEVFLGVQALSAYHAAAACWHLGMNHHRPSGDSNRHTASAASSARVFDTMLRALERRQAKPLGIPVGRPDSRVWNEPHPSIAIKRWEQRCSPGEAPPDTGPLPVWTPQDIEIAETLMEKERIAEENEGLDIENTEGILPGGGMILPEDPTPNQKAYLGRRLKLMYVREIQENRRNGITKLPKIRGIRPGDLIP